MGYGLLKVVGTKPQVMTMGVIDLRKYGDHYLKLRRIFERVVGIIEAYLPDELAIEAVGKTHVIVATYITYHLGRL